VSLASAPSAVPSNGPSASPAAAFREWTRIDMPDPAPGVYDDGSPTGVVAFHGTYVATGSVGAGANGDPSLNWGVVWTLSDGRSWTLSDHLAAFEHASLIYSPGCWRLALPGSPARRQGTDGRRGSAWPTATSSL
jgi:hypothetical protein